MFLHLDQTDTLHSPTSKSSHCGFCAELELDSLSRIELLVEIEREFDLEMPEDTDDGDFIQKIQSVSETIQLVLDHLATEKTA